MTDDSYVSTDSITNDDGTCVQRFATFEAAYDFAEGLAKLYSSVIGEVLANLPSWSSHDTFDVWASGPGPHDYVVFTIYADSTIECKRF